MHWCLFDDYPFGVKVRDDSDTIGDAVLEKCYELDEEHLTDPYTGDLLHRLFNKYPFSRIKSSAMKRHPFFASVEWDEIRRRELQGPFWDLIPGNIRTPAASDKPKVDGQSGRSDASMEDLEDCPEGILSPTERSSVVVPDASHDSQISFLHLLCLLPFLIPFFVIVAFV